MNCGEIGVVDVVITETGRTLKDAKNIIFIEKSTEERNYLRKERDGKYEHVSPSSTAKLSDERRRSVTPHRRLADLPWLKHFFQLET